MRDRRKRRRQARTFAFFLTLIIVIALITLVASIVYYVVQLSKMSGTWVEEHDYTDIVATNISSWMSDIEGEEITADYVKSRLDGLYIETVFVLDGEGLTGGNYKIYIDEDSYNSCEDMSNKVMADILEEVVAKRLVEKGLKENITPEESAFIAQDVLGCSVEDYLSQNGVRVLDTYENINNAVKDEGTYKLNLHYITQNNGTKEAEIRYVYDDGKLIIPEKNAIYGKQVAK